MADFDLNGFASGQNEEYSVFAYFYDELMDAVPYGEWTERIEAFIGEYGVTKKRSDAEEDALSQERDLVVDLGCGTGTLTEQLYDKGYDMIGIDISDRMLSIAMDKRNAKGSNILYLLQDMREFELYSTVGTIISVCDSVNYILEEDELLQVFSLVNNYLFPGGIFIFDFNTDYKYREVIGETTIAENRDDCSFIWENYYDEESCVNEYDLTLFVQTEGECYRKFEETHFQRGYTPEQIESLLKKAGLTVLKMADAEELGPVTGTSERVCVVAAGTKNML